LSGHLQTFSFLLTGNATPVAHRSEHHIAPQQRCLLHSFTFQLCTL